MEPSFYSCVDHKPGFKMFVVWCTMDKQNNGNGNAILMQKHAHFDFRILLCYSDAAA